MFDISEKNKQNKKAKQNLNFSKFFLKSYCLSFIYLA